MVSVLRICSLGSRCRGKLLDVWGLRSRCNFAHITGPNASLLLLLLLLLLLAFKGKSSSKTMRAAS